MAGTIFGLVCLGQLLRLVTQMEITVASRVVPLWLSAVAVVATGCLCFWLWRLSLTVKPSASAVSAGTIQSDRPL